MSVPQLRIVTYLCPSIPVELFQEIAEVLEKGVGLQTTLQYEWRSEGHSEKRLDPFQNNLVDLAFMPASGYIALSEKKNDFAELLPISPVFKHPKNNQHTVGAYIDLVIYSDKIKHNISEILDLRGCRWACVHENSLANGVMLNELKQLGENITFFGSAHRASSHLASVNMVLTKQVDVATIDAASLTCNRRFLHNGGKDVIVLKSFGPYAPYAIVINNRIKSDLKNKIITALKTINDKDDRFAKFGLLNFAPNTIASYEKEKNFLKDLKTKTKVPYY